MQALSVSDLNEALDEVSLWCLVFLGLGIFIFIGAMCQTYFFTKAGANLTHRIRSSTFEAMLKQECGWFDDHKNSVGALGSRLSSDAANIQTVYTSFHRIGNLKIFFYQFFFQIFPGDRLSVEFNSAGHFNICYWNHRFIYVIYKIVTGLFGKRTIFTNCCLLRITVRFSIFRNNLNHDLIKQYSISLLINISRFKYSRHLAKSALSEKQAIEAGTKIASESIANIRTVASLRKKLHFTVI